MTSRWKTKEEEVDGEAGASVSLLSVDSGSFVRSFVQRVAESLSSLPTLPSSFYPPILCNRLRDPGLSIALSNPFRTLLPQKASSLSGRGRRALGLDTRSKLPSLSFR